MNPYIQMLLFMIGAVIVLAVLIIRNNRRHRAVMLNMFRRRFGQVPDREYASGELERISRYFRRRPGNGFFVDDITWNDLDMDSIYMLMNQTVSSPGEDYLYYILRTPCFTREELEERDRLIEFFMSHDKERESMQLLLAKVGKNRFGSLSDTIFALESAPKIPLRSHIIMLVLIGGSLLLLPFAPMQGFLGFFVLSIANFGYYFAGKNKKEVDVYLSCFESLSRILNAADEMETVDWPIVAKQMENIKKGKKAFSSYRKKAVWIAGKDEVTSNNIVYIIMDYVRMLTHVDFLMFNRVVKEVQGKQKEIFLLVDNIGELDAVISIASYRKFLSLYCKPELSVYTGGEAVMDVQDLYHPLITEPVANTIVAKGGTLVTGSNASGKSTFLKIVAINGILAQTVYTCTCTRYQAPFLKVMTSMALRDDLFGGESYFIVEIKSLKRILDESRKPEPLLCIIDEVLRGTNTIERIAASARILKELCQPWMLPFAATHDIELSYILENVYTNYHFEEEIKEKDVLFNYILHQGRAMSRNAIKLLEVCGYDQQVVAKAREAAQHFEETNEWETIKGE